MKSEIKRDMPCTPCATLTHMTRLVGVDEARAHLDPHTDALVEVVLRPFALWRTFVEETPALALPLGESERAQILHANMRFEARQKFDSVSGVTPTGALDFFALYVEPHVLLRIKHLNGGPQNYPTDQQQLLHQQLYDDDMMSALALDGVVEPPTLLTLGYRLNLDASEVSSIVVRRDLKGHPPWEYGIYGAAEGTMAEPQVLPNIPPVVPARITSKKTKRQPREGDAAQ